MKYWVYIDGQVPGCYLPTELTGLRGFGQTTLVCPAEGEISEKNWRRAGEFTDLATLIQSLEGSKAPAKPLEPAPVSGDVDALIDTASQRLFGHVAELMKELENRREEKALLQSLQRQLLAFKADLQAEREKNALAETRLARITELEDARRRDLATIQKLEQGARDRDESIAGLRNDLDLLKNELEAAKRRLGETANDLAIRNRLVDKISKDLTEKELSLAKSLAVIRRLEEDLHRILPGGPGPAPEAAAAAAAPMFSPAPVEPVEEAVPLPEPEAAAPSPVIEEEPAHEEPKTELSLPEAPPPAAPSESPAQHQGRKAWLRRSNQTPMPKSGYTTDDPPPPPPVVEPDPEKLGAQNALVDFFRKVMKKDKPEA